MNRAGFSLAELMVALVIAGIIGVALTRLVISQARFVARQDGAMRARAVARAALSVLSDELRQVPFGGVVSAHRDSVILRVPYAFGLVCGQASGTTVTALFPPDSARYASAITAGYAWRDDAGVWHVVEPATRTASGTGLCASASPSITVIPSAGGISYGAAVAPNDITTPIGGMLYVYQRIIYAFGASTEMPGRRGLFREVVGSGMREELAAPFDTSSVFTFLTGPALRMELAPPPSLDSIGGLRILLVAASERPPAGQTVPTRFSIVADMIFRNHDQ